jgi:cytochrome c oxidase subunit 2
VIHGFYLPAFRVKRDAVPGMESHVWFMAPNPGSYDLFCSQYCGTGHSSMITTVEALPEVEFTAWLNRQIKEKTKEAKEGEERSGAGRDLLEKFGCLGCHSLDGSSKVGPSFKGIWGRSVTVITGNTERTITVDDAYLRRSIREPNAAVVKGYPPVMPVIPMKDDELTAVIAFLKGVR